MEQSTLLMSAKISFIEADLSIVHIPLDKYNKHLPSILKLLFPSAAAAAGDEDGLINLDKIHMDNSWANQHAFLNVSVTPIEASIVCESQLAVNLFQPLIEQSREGHDFGKLSGDLVVMAVEGEGMEAGKRVLELTSPLALAGISLFFVTTYWSDYILVPAKARNQVVGALQARGFRFEKTTKTYFNPAGHHRHMSSSSSTGSGSPATPPPKTLTELQARTFDLLKRHAIVPGIRPDIRLVQCSGRNRNPDTFEADELALQLGITKCLIHHPKFLSLTMTKEDSASILLEKRLLPDFDMPIGNNVLLGGQGQYLVPITLDLGKLSMEATGIVCGVAGRLVDGAGMLRPIDMNYLSTASAGTVIVNETDLDIAMLVLRLDVYGSIKP